MTDDCHTLSRWLLINWQVMWHKKNWKESGEIQRRIDGKIRLRIRYGFFAKMVEEYNYHISIYYYSTLIDVYIMKFYMEISPQSILHAMPIKARSLSLL